MQVPEYLAQEIVGSMKEIINQDVNYINTDAIIIASTNEVRVGTFHGGAKRVIATQDEVAISVDGQYEGTKQGVNLPVYFQNNIVGVIGITGSEEEVGKYGKIIQSMTEVLIKEAYLLEQENIGRESKKQFIEELLFRNHKEDIRTVNMRADLLGIRVNIPRTMLVARIYEDDTSEEFITPTIQEKIYTLIKSYIEFNAQNLIVQSGMNYILLLHTNPIKDINPLIETICEEIYRQYNTKICFGIGSLSTNAIEIRRSYVEAKKALEVAQTLTKHYIVDYQDLDIELLLEEVPYELKNKFISKVFKNMKQNEVESYKEILISYFRNNGSITKTSEELFLHKNTLQYKLNKLKKMTNYDPRKAEELVVLYLAVLLLRLDK